MADAEQRADRVEEPAHARGRHALHAACELPFEHGELARRGRTTGGSSGVPRDPGRPQVRECGAVRLADRRVAAGQRHVAQVRDPVEASRSARAGPRRPRSPRRFRSRCRRTRSRSPRHPAASPCSAITATTCAWWCCTSATSHGPARARLRPPAGLVAGMGVGDDACRVDLVHRGELRRPSARTPRASRRCPCRRCAGSAMRHGPSARQNVFLSSPPTASSVDRDTAARSAAARTRASGGSAAPPRRPRARRSRRRARGSAGRGRATRRRARPAGARASASSKQIGSSVRLPLVITRSSGTGAAPAIVQPGREQQVVQRRVRQQHADERVVGRDERRQRRIGPAPRAARSAGRATRAGWLRRRRPGEPPRDVEVARPSPRTACRRGPCAPATGATGAVGGRGAGEVVPAEALDRDDRARGERGLRRRERGVGAVDRAPAGLEPDPRAAAGQPPAARGSGGRRDRRTRPRTAAHSAKPAIVVFGRSYGSRIVIVNRGPQFVHVMNG